MLSAQVLPKLHFMKTLKKKKLYKWTIEKKSLKRWGNSYEIAELVEYLLSEKSSFINGENIKIDGDGIMRNAIGLIPTRLNSRRLPRKSLKMIGNLPLYNSHIQKS